MGIKVLGEMEKAALSTFKNFIKLSITKQSPGRFEDVGNICLETFLLSLVLPVIRNPPIGCLSEKIEGRLLISMS